MPNILSLATASLKSGQLEDKHHIYHPRVDYVELQRLHDVKVLDYSAYRDTPLGKSFTRLETYARSDLYLALLGFLHRRKHNMVFAWSERAGIPYAILRRLGGAEKPFAAMFTCWSSRQEKVITRLNLFNYMDTIAVHCESMRKHFLSLGVPADKIHLIPYSVDQRFFHPLPEVEQQPGLVLSLGEIRSRNYSALFKAVEGLPLNLLVAASGSWYAREKETGLKVPVPSNVTLSGRYSLPELKKLYACSQFVVLPLVDQVFSAGATSSLEAMCMGRAVIAFRSRGIVDFIIDGETGILVEPGNTEAMRDAILYLLENPKEARRMGENGRQRVVEKLNLDHYVGHIATWLNKSLQ
jgi:glycosyltransferase involved in cell wall biosynthesis